jgi:excisionase family DNA binding protein
MTMETTVNPREVAQLLGIRLDTVYSLIWSGRLRAEKRDGRWLISRAAVDQRLQAREERNG